MAQQRVQRTETVSPVLLALGSLAILAHLGAVGIRVLAAPSGPWPGPEGMDMAGPPAFAQALYEQMAQRYLKLIQLTHDYQFSGNRPARPGIYFEVRLKDSRGEALTTVRFPDPEANAWVRYRQGLLAQGLGPDQPLPPPAGEAIPAPNQQVPTVPIWDIMGERSLRLRRVAEHLVPRDRPVFRPTEWSLVLVRSYSRYLCRKHGAASAELVRHTRDPMPPTAFLTGEPPAGAFADLVASYGETSGE